MTLALYLARRFLQSIAFSAAAVTAIILLVSSIELLRRVGSRDVSLRQVATMAALQTPEIALSAMPFVMMLASLWCFTQLARNSELVVTRAAGVSVWALVLPSALSSVVLGCLVLTVINPVASAASQRFETLEARLLAGRASRLSASPEGLWLRQGDGTNQTVIHARRSNPSATELANVTLYSFEGQDRFIERIDATDAQLTPGSWQLNNAVRRRFDVSNDLSIIEERAETINVPTDLTSTQILDSFARPGSLGFWVLPRFIETLEASGFSAQRHRLQWHSLLATPLLYCAMGLIGAAFSMRHHRFGGLGAMAFGAVIAGFGFYFVSDVAKALAASAAIPASLGAWGPPVAAAFSAVGLLLQLEDG